MPFGPRPPQEATTTRIPPRPDPHLPDLRRLASEPRDLARTLTSLLPRATGLLDTAERLLAAAAAVIAHIDDDERRARGVIDGVARTHRQLSELVARCEPTVEQYHRVAEETLPALQRLSAALRQVAPPAPESGDGGDDIEQDVAAAREALRRGPRVAELLETEIVPALETLRSVAPDLSELLETSRALNEIIGSVPGLGRTKKRVDKRTEDD